MCALVFLAAFESLAVTTIMPAVSLELHGAALYAVAFAAPLASGVVGMVAAGAWADRAGPARPLVAAASAFVAGLVVAGTAPTMAVLAGGRLLQGLGGGALTVVAYVVVARLYPGDLHPRVFAGFSAAWVVPSLVGPPVAGLVAEQADWRWVFLGVALLVPPIALVVLARVRGVGAPDPVAPEAPEPDRASPRTTSGASSGETAGAAGVATGGRRVAWATLAALAVLVLGISPELGGAATGTLAVVGVVGALAAARPLLPRGTLRAVRGLPAVVADRGLLAAGFFGAEVYLPYLLTRRYDVPPTFAGISLTAAAITWATASWVQGRLGSRLPHARAIRIGTAAVTVAIASAAVGAALRAPVGVLVSAWALAGAGMGLTYARQTVLVLRLSPPGAEGTNSSAISVADSIGASLALSVTGVLFTSVAHRGGPVPYATCLALAAVMALGSALVALRVQPHAERRRPGRAQAPPSAQAPRDASAART
ncbi:MFS transporter [Cellulomonas sp. DKR-3]|uniref:MFS transporter n=2 Tax=Cellulomonas fulva TaxID=2835530 RepID=A0ABS5U382_9CELL|nr:MFS transporter [Cellulomonas fulva]